MQTTVYTATVAIAWLSSTIVRHAASPDNLRVADVHLTPVRLHEERAGRVASPHVSGIARPVCRQTHRPPSHSGNFRRAILLLLLSRVARHELGQGGTVQLWFSALPLMQMASVHNTRRARRCEQLAPLHNPHGAWAHAINHPLTAAIACGVSVHGCSVPAAASALL